MNTNRPKAKESELEIEHEAGLDLDRTLPELIANPKYNGKIVALHGSEVVAVGHDAQKVSGDACSLGFHPGAVLILRVEPPIPI